MTILVRGGAGGWQVMQAEKITFNQKDRLREGSGQGGDLKQDTYKSLRPVEIAQAGLLRVHAGGYLVARMGNAWQPVAADGMQVKTATSFAMLWSMTPVAIQPDRNTKTLTALQPADIYAILPGGDPNEAVAGFLNDPANFEGVGETNPDAAFEERMALLVAVAGTTTGDGASTLQKILLDGMQTAQQRLSSGIAKKADLDEGLKYVAVSAKAYPRDDQQKTARDALLTQKDWLERRMAILNALRAGERWDEFLNKYGEFDRWDNSFDDLHKGRDKAFQNSGQQHRAAGEAYYNDQNYALALLELKIAQAYLPGNQDIVGLIEKVTLDDEQQTAKKRVTVVVDKTSSGYRVVTQHLLTADLDMGDNKLDDAQREIDQARGAGANDPRVLLSTAKLQHKRRKLPEALATLEQYFRQVTSDDVADALRTQIKHDLTSGAEKDQKSVRDSEKEGDYVTAWQSAQDGLQLDDHDLFFLLHAGVDGAMLRKPDAATMLDKYLSLSQTPGADQKERAQVYAYSAQIAKLTLPKSEGAPNWFSGYNSPAGLMYCPISLMPNAHVSRIVARKWTTAFQWDGDHVSSIHTTSQDNNDPNNSSVFFEYLKDGGAARRVSTAMLDSPKDDPPAPQFTPKGTVGKGNGAYPGLPNNPVVDPLMVERLTGHPVATLVSGSLYFHPFVWSGGLYTFLAEYDDQGRVASARALAKYDEQGQMTAMADAVTLDFRWDGLKLMEIAQRGGDYKRTMIYMGNKLTEERVSFHGKSSSIKYEYKGDQLMKATTNEDASIDNRSREVTFDAGRAGK